MPLIINVFRMSDHLRKKQYYLFSHHFARGVLTGVVQKFGTPKYKASNIKQMHKLYLRTRKANNVSEFPPTVPTSMSPPPTLI